MAPKKQSTARARPRAGSDDDEQPEEYSQDASQSQSQSQSQSDFQDITVKAFTDAIAKQKEKAQDERKAEEEQVREDKQKDIAKVQARMHECREQHAQLLQDLRRPKIERLRKLLEQKRGLEKRIQDCYAQIDQTYESTLEQYQIVVRGKLKDLAEQSA